MNVMKGVRKHGPGLLAIVLATSFFFGAVTFINETDETPKRTRITMTASYLYDEAAIGWYQGYATWADNPTYIYTNQTPSPPGTYNDQFDMRFDVQGTIGAGATISSVTLVYYKGHQGTVSSGVMWINLLTNSFQHQWDGTDAVVEDWAYETRNPVSDPTNHYITASTTLASAVQADYDVDGHFYVQLSKGTMVQENAYAIRGHNATYRPYLNVTYTITTPPEWAPTITSTPPAGTHAVLNYTVHDDPVAHTVTGSGNYSPTADTYLDSYYHTTNYGTDTLLRTIDWDGPDPDQHARTAMRWNLTSLGVPANATITGAYLWLYQTQSRALTNTIGLSYYYTATDWAENSVTWDSTYSPYSYGTYPTPTSFSDSVGWHNITVTGLVEYEYQYHGKAKLTINPSVSSSSTANRFASKEYTIDTNLRPKMVVTWEYSWFTNGTASPAYTIRPDSDVSSLTMTGTPDVSPNLHENLQSNDGDGSYIYASGTFASNYANFTMSDITPSGENYTISTVTMFYTTSDYYAQFTVDLYNGTTKIFDSPATGSYLSYTTWTRTWDYYPLTQRLWTETDIDNLRVYVYGTKWGGSAKMTEIGITIQANETLDTDVYRYVYVTGDHYSYTPTANETVTWDTSGGIPSWATWSSGNHTVWGTVTGGNETVHIRAHSTAGDLYAYQNYTVEVWGAVAGYWAPTFTSSPVTTGNRFDMYNYSVTCNETFTWGVYTNATWLVVTDANFTIWGIPGVYGSYYVNIKATSVAGELWEWQNYTLDIAVNPWAPHVTNSPTYLSINNQTYWSFTWSWNDTVTGEGLDTDATWLSYSIVNNTVWGTSNEYGTFYVNITGTSVPGTLQGYYNFSIIVAPPTVTQKYFAWLTSSGIMFLIGTIGFIGMIGTPWFYLKYGTGDKRRLVVVAIGMWFFFFGLFYGSVVVFG